jgi:thiol-disulfide isomerase/thioredoxin
MRRWKVCDTAAFTYQDRGASGDGDLSAAVCCCSGSGVLPNGTGFAMPCPDACRVLWEALVRAMAVIVIAVLLSLPVLAGGAPPGFQLQNLNGSLVRLSDYLEKKVVFIDFWGTYCGPCLRELAQIQELHEEFKDKGLIVLTVNVDPAANLSRVRAYVKSQQYTLPILIDQDAKVLESYNPTRTLPYSVLVDSSGQIARRYDGYRKGDEVLLREQVLGLLGQPANKAAAPADPATQEKQPEEHSGREAQGSGE